MIQNIDEQTEPSKPEKFPINHRVEVSNELYRLAQEDVFELDRRQKKKDRRGSVDQRACFRFAANESDADAYIVVREQHNSTDEKTGQETSVVVDVPYDVVLKDHSSGGFGFLMRSETPLEVGHVIRLWRMSRMHLIRIRNIRPTDTEGIQIIGAEYIEDLIEEQPPELSVLELFVDRRLTVGRLKGTMVLISVVILSWLAVLGYAVSLKLAQ